MDRRGFLKCGLHAAIALPAVVGCAQVHNRGIGSRRSSPTSKLIDALEGTLPELLREENVPGLSVAVVDEGEIGWRRGFGYRDAASRLRVDEETIFEAASMSKPVFAYASLKLCEKGVIGLDAPIPNPRPEGFEMDDRRHELITPRHLLSHSSGLPTWRSGAERLRLHAAPGSEYRYSGEGYYYLQSAVTRLMGKTDKTDCAKFEDDLEVCATDIDEFMRRNVLAPFRMTSSGYHENPGGRNASGHDQAGNPHPRRKRSRPSVARYAAAGGLLTTPTDYARFIIEVLNPKGPDEFRLKRATIDEMLRPHVKAASGAHVSWWGLGWQIHDSDLFGHGGNNQGFHSHALASRRSQRAIVVMTNGDNGPGLLGKLFAARAIQGFLGGAG